MAAKLRLVLHLRRDHDDDDGAIEVAGRGWDFESPVAGVHCQQVPKWQHYRCNYVTEGLPMNLCSSGDTGTS